MTRGQLFRHLDWPQFLRVFFFIDVANLVVPVWDSLLRLAGATSPQLDDLREMSSAARLELQELVSEAAERASR